MLRLPTELLLQSRWRIRVLKLQPHWLAITHPIEEILIVAWKDMDETAEVEHLSFWPSERQGSIEILFPGSFGIACGVVPLRILLAYI